MRRWSFLPRRELPAGAIFAVARNAGIEFRATGTKRPICCPFHDDRHPSAFLSDRNVFYCSVCTPEAGWPAWKFAQALGLPSRSGAPTITMARRWSSPLPPSAPTFGAEHAGGVWNLALQRVARGNADAAVRAVHEYLFKRGLSAASGRGLFGVLAPDKTLPPPVARWPAGGYQLVAPLFDHAGDIVNLQARSIRNADPKTLFPKGSRVAGTVFASPSGLALLRGKRCSPPGVLLAEGLTDYLALAVASPVPMFACPGAAMAKTSIGPWVAGLNLVLATDCDTAGEAVVADTGAVARQFGAKTVGRLLWPQRCKDACEVVERLGMPALVHFLSALLHV